MIGRVSALGTPRSGNGFAERWHSLLVRDDGEAVGCGFNNHNQVNVPALPPGACFVGAMAGHAYSMLLRDNGEAIGFGAMMRAAGARVGKAKLHTRPSARESDGRSLTLTQASEPAVAVGKRREAGRGQRA